MPLATPLVAPFDDATRLYRLEGAGAGPVASSLSALMVEAWSQREALNTPWEMQLSAIGTDARLNIRTLPGQSLSLITRLSDGSELRRTGLITNARRGHSDGGLTRYRLTVRPWLALLAHTTRSQVWQEQSLVDIVDSIFARYPAHAAWRWADDVAEHLAQSPFNGSSPAQGRAVRSYTVQYRQSDLSFIEQLLTQEGIGYRFEQSDAAPLGHRLVLFADSANAASCPEDTASASPLGGVGIRFHRAASLEVQDAVQALGRSLSSIPGTTTVTSWDYQAHRSTVGRASTDWPQLAGRARKPNVFTAIEDYVNAGAYAFYSQAQADRAAQLLQQAHECRWESWPGRSSVRSFACGQHFSLTQSTLGSLAEKLAEHHASHLQDVFEAELPQRSFVLTEVIHAGINNLPKDTSERLAAMRQRSGLNRDGGGHGLLAPWVGPELRQQAQATGYGNAFSALRRHRPWRPRLTDAQGRRIEPRQRMNGVLSATVVGARGQIAPEGADEIHTDALGRVRIAFDFQLEAAGQRAHQAANTSVQSTWVRVAQSLSGPGMGAQFIPRIGQEVIVGFDHGHLERPWVMGALYNGRGEGGITPTLGGQQTQATGAASPEVFTRSGDHRPSGQGNLIGTGTGGHSPAWHGASPGEIEHGGQRNAAALSGIKTKEFGGVGHNQLVFDDSQGQLRVQLATTQYSTQLNLGHLIHQADNHRGSLRGEGFELRTDAYGSIRARMGVCLTSYALASNGSHPGSSEPAGDNLAGMALSRRLFLLGKALNEAAHTHQTVRLSSHIGTIKANQSALSKQEAPLKALHTGLSGMVQGPSTPGGASGTSGDGFALATEDASNKNTSAQDGKLPHSTDAILSVNARAGLALAAGQDIQVAASEGITLGAGADIQIATGGAARLHTGQAIGVLGGAIKPGEQAAGTGLSLIAAQGEVELQAQSDQLQIAAKGLVHVQSQNAHIDWAAAKRIVVSVAGGASMTMEGGNITFECPGTITVRAGMKSFTGPDKASYLLPQMPRTVCVDCLKNAMASGSPVAALN